MKLGVFADVHGDISNLKLVLKFFETQKVDTIVCAGDLVDRGNSGDQVVRLVREKFIPTVRGNHDESPWTPNLLTSDTRTYLQALPTYRKFRWNNTRVYLAHGCPWNNITYVPFDSPHTLFHRVASEAASDIVILGHTHAPMVVSINQGSSWIFNPGSASRFATKKPTCGIITLPDQHSHVPRFQIFTIPQFAEAHPYRVESHIA